MIYFLDGITLLLIVVDNSISMPIWHHINQDSLTLSSVSVQRIKNKTT